MREWKNGVVLKQIDGMVTTHKVGDLIRLEQTDVGLCTVEDRSGLASIACVPLRYVTEEIVKCPGSY